MLEFFLFSLFILLSSLFMGSILGIDTQNIKAPECAPAGRYPVRIVFAKHQDDAGQPLVTSSGRSQILFGVKIADPDYQNVPVIFHRFMSLLETDTPEYIAMQERNLAIFLDIFDLRECSSEEELCASAVGREANASIALKEDEEFGIRNEVKRFF